MKKADEIKKQISKIKEPDPNKRAQKTLKILNESAEKFVELFKKIFRRNYTSISHLKKELMRLSASEFYEYLNEQAGFKKAKSRLIKKKIISPEINEVHPDSQQYYIKQYCLEYICANCFVFIAANPRLGDCVVIPKKWKTLVKNNEGKLILMARNFEFQAQEQLFLWLVKQLKCSKGNVNNSGKKHKSQMREVMVKKLIESVLQFFQKEKISVNLVANISQDISGIFFDAMRLSDAQVLVKNISQYVKHNNLFLQKTVIDIISGKTT